MKHLKRLLVVAAAVVMAMALAVPAFAADTHSISVKDTDTHTYNVYQVLTGTMAQEGDQNLGNPAWGADVKDKTADVAAFIESLNGKTEEEVAALVASKVDTSGAGQGTVSKGNPIRGLATGYYVLVDKTVLTGDYAKDTKALNVVQVVNDIEGLEIKWDTTSDEKTITTDTLGKGEPNQINGDTDNVSVGDTVNYKIEAKIPAKATNYNYYYFVINDTLSEGLTFNGDVAVYKDSIADANKLALGTDYELKTAPNADGKTFAVGMTNAKSLAGKTIIVTYSAVLNENAKIGEEANKNTSTVIFSNDPNHNYDGDNNPSFPGEADKDVVGETPVTETETYTTGIEIQKVDENGDPLTGAEFTISGDSAQIVLVSAEEFTADEQGTYYKLKDGTYTTEAPTVDAMVEAEAGATAGYVEDAAYTGDDKVVVDGKAYRPYAPATDTDAKVYIYTKGTADQYDSTETLYKKTVTYTQMNTVEGTEAKAEVGADGVVSFVGLGAGTYTIHESKTPAGYNTIADKTLEISFAADGTPKWSTSSSDADYDAAAGVFKMTIENHKGTELPSTGGIGTTILYAVGVILVIGAGVYLVTKRRARRDSETEMIEE